MTVKQAPEKRHNKPDFGVSLCGLIIGAFLPFGAEIAPFLPCCDLISTGAKPDRQILTPHNVKYCRIKINDYLCAIQHPNNKYDYSYSIVYKVFPMVCVYRKGRSAGCVDSLKERFIFYPTPNYVTTRYIGRRTQGVRCRSSRSREILRDCAP